MRLLLDTHVVLWLAGGPDRISERVAASIHDAEQCCVSVASAWEYGAKRAKFPGRLTKSFDELVGVEMVRLDFPFRLHRFAEGLPPIHHDPFDRMLIAQAIDQELTLVSADAIVRRYTVASLW